MDEVSEVLKDCPESIKDNEEIKVKIIVLRKYQESGQWLLDYECDERGELPADLKRGVLSEDAVYDLITDHSALMARMQRAVLRSIEKKEL